MRDLMRALDPMDNPLNELARVAHRASARASLHDLVCERYSWMSGNGAAELRTHSESIRVSTGSVASTEAARRESRDESSQASRQKAAVSRIPDREIPLRAAGRSSEARVDQSSRTALEPFLVSAEERVRVAESLRQDRARSYEPEESSMDSPPYETSIGTEPGRKTFEASRPMGARAESRRARFFSKWQTRGF
jgi:hypothetical protein